MTHVRRLRFGAIALTLVLGVAAVPAYAAETVDISGKTGKNLRFVGPDTISSGERLAVKNRTNPRQVGPHTFSLVADKHRPSRGEYNACYQGGGVCNAIFEAHEAGPKGIGKRSVDDGRPGWDLHFNKRREGDSWVTDDRGARHARVVSARPGTTLYLFCAIHPNMQDQIRVVD